MRLPEVLSYSRKISQKRFQFFTEKIKQLSYSKSFGRYVMFILTAPRNSRAVAGYHAKDMKFHSKQQIAQKTTASALSFLSEVLFWSFRRQLQPVSELIDRLDIRCPIQFFSQLLNMYIHGADIAQIIKAPCQI